MENYQANSHRSKELAAAEQAPEKRVDKKVVSGEVKTRDNKVRKLTDIFVPGDVENVKSYIFMDVLVPAIKDAISSIVKDSIDMILFDGKGGSGNKSRSGSKANGYVSYRKYYDEPREERRSRDNYGSRDDSLYEDIVFESRADAEAVRREMLAILDRFKVVSMLDLYDLAGKTPPRGSSNWGWTNIRDAEPVRVRGGGYILSLPKAMPID